MDGLSLGDIENFLLEEEAEVKRRGSVQSAATPKFREDPLDTEIFAPKRTLFSSSPRETRKGRKGRGREVRTTAYKAGRSYSVQPKGSIWEKRSPYERKRAPIIRRKRASVQSNIGDYSRPSSPSPLRGGGDRADMLLGKGLREELSQVNIQIKQLCISILDSFSLAQMHLSSISRLDYSENPTLAILDQARETKSQLEECNGHLEKMAKVTLERLSSQEIRLITQKNAETVLE